MWDVAQSAADHKIELCDLTPPDSTRNCISDGQEDDLKEMSTDIT